MNILWLCILYFFCMTHIMTPKENMHVYGMILTGGVGERLWPLSRIHYPKQFLSINNKDSLLKQAIDRLRGVVEKEHMWAITAKQHLSLIQNSVGAHLGNIIVEPIGRNTGPAVLLSCLELYKKDPDAIVVFVPADPYIPEKDYDLFCKYVHQATIFADRHDGIVLCGVRPTYPATGYGYIEYIIDEAYSPIFRVARFHEKPSLALAQNYIQQPHMLWNICMFVGKVSVFIEEFKNVAPDLYAEVIGYLAGDRDYKDVTSISVDCAVIEQSNNVWVLPVNFSWCDVGNVETFLSIQQSQSASHNIISVNAQDNLISVPTNKVVALVGVDDLCIVDTGDALLISKRSEAENVRAVVRHLNNYNMKEYV